VKDPRDVVKAGDIVKVKVLEVDVARKRIALTRRLDDTPGQATSRPGPRDERGQGPRRDAGGPNRGPNRGQGNGGRPAVSAPPANNALAEAFARAKRS
jgi:protein Tex